MTDFRKWFVALAVLVLIAGTASAQVLQCTANSVSTRVRAEGRTELVGDVTLVCTGAVATTVNANIQIYLGKDITSKLMTGSLTEALLTLDEPLRAIQTLGDNVRQGTRTGTNSLIWYTVPVLTPDATVRTIRITNVRANVAEDPSLIPAYPLEISMLVTVQSTVPLPINNSTVKVAAIVKGMDFAVVKCTDPASSTSMSLSQCADQGKTDPTSSSHAPQALLKFTEGYDASFKIQKALNQELKELLDAPDASESGYIMTGGIGLATNGTRLLVRFNNIPNGAAIFVSTRPTNTVAKGTSDTIGGSGAKLVSVTDANGLGGSVLFPIAATGSHTGTCAATGKTDPADDPNGVVQVPLYGGAGYATWEIIKASNNAIESVAFAVEVAYSAKPDQNLPALTDGTPGQAIGLLAPVSSDTTMSLSAPIPRFAEFPRTKTLVDIKSCASVLMFPFVTARGGFDTGIAISNTTMDNSVGMPGGASKKPYATTAQNGACVLYYFGDKEDGTSLTAPVQTSSVVNGGKQLVYTVFGGGMGVAATPGFQGYIIGVCNFELAHGFAFISDLGAQKLAMGYLALVMDTNTKALGGSRSGVLEALNQ